MLGDGMISNLTVRVVAFTTHINNTMRGVCSVEIVELHIVIHGIGVHTKDGRSWVSLPSKPWVRDGQIVTGDDGKPKYFPILEFTDKSTLNDFSAIVIEALRQHNPRALVMGVMQ